MRAARILGAVALSGALLALSLPPHYFSLLGWVVWVPLLLSTRRCGFAVGFGSGLAACLFGAWIDASGFLLKPMPDAGSSSWIYTGFLLFGLVSGGVLGVAGESERLRAKPVCLAALAVLLEAVLLVYLPAHMALTQSRSTAILWLATVTGIWGASYLVWLANLAAAWLISAHRRRLTLVCFAVCSLLSVSWLPPKTGNVRVAMIQTPSTDPDELKGLNASAGKSGAVVAVWPELSGLLAVTDGDTEELSAIATSPGQPAFVTSFEEPGPELPFNVARLFGPGYVSPGYQKRKPFAGEAQMHAAGKAPAVAQWQGITYGLNICFDSCFPSIMRDTAHQEGVQLILLPTLDPDTPCGVIQSIHAAFTPFRAAELGIPIVRADTTAFSMAVDAGGRTIAQAGVNQREVVVAPVHLERRWTLARSAGDWFLWVAACLFGLTFWNRRSRERMQGSAIGDDGP